MSLRESEERIRRLIESGKTPERPHDASPLFMLPAVGLTDARGEPFVLTPQNTVAYYSSQPIDTPEHWDPYAVTLKTMMR